MQQSSRESGEGVGGRGRSTAVSSTSYSNPGESTKKKKKKQRRADDAGGEGGKVRDLTSKSSSEYRTLFLWKGWGLEGEKKASMITPLCLSLGLSVPLFGHSRTDKHWLPDMALVFFKRCRTLLVYFVVMRLVKWN